MFNPFHWFVHKQTRLRTGDSPYASVGRAAIDWTDAPHFLHELSCVEFACFFGTGAMLEYLSMWELLDGYFIRETTPRLITRFDTPGAALPGFESRSSSGS
jgi:hypothetical protein